MSAEPTGAHYYNCLFFNESPRLCLFLHGKKSVSCCFYNYIPRKLYREVIIFSFVPHSIVRGGRTSGSDPPPLPCEGLNPRGRDNRRIRPHKGLSRRRSVTRPICRALRPWRRRPRGAGLVYFQRKLFPLHTDISTFTRMADDYFVFIYISFSFRVG